MEGRGLDLPGSEHELETAFCKQVFGLSNMREIPWLNTIFSRGSLLRGVLFNEM
jgi:hypothetical protein